MSNVNQIRSAVEDMQQVRGVFASKADLNDMATSLALKILESAEKRLADVATDLEKSPATQIEGNLKQVIETLQAGAADFFKDMK